MITLTKSGNAIVFTFDGNDHYLNDGTIEVPVNSLTLVTDESQMATFKRSSTNDIFISARYDELGMSKSDLESWFKENACGSTGVDSGTVQTMIDESISGKADTSDVQNVASDVATVSGDVATLSGDVANKADTTAVTASINAAVSGKMDTSAFNTYSASTDARLSEDEEVTSAALNELNDALDDKADTTAVTASIAAAVSGKQDTLIAGSGITIDSANTISCTVEGGGKAIVAGRGIAVTTGATADTVSFDLPIGNFSTSGGGGSSYTVDNLLFGRNAFPYVGSYGYTKTSNVLYGRCYNNSIIGGYNQLSGSTTTASYSDALNGYNFIVGDSNTIKLTSNVYSSGKNIILGSNNNITSSKKLEKIWLLGDNNTGSTSNTFIIGYYNKALNTYESAFGLYNNSVSGSSTWGESGNTLFSVGNGTAANARHNAFEIRQNGDIYITSGGTDIKLQDNLGGGVPESAFTAYTAATEARLAEDEEVTAAALNTLDNKYSTIETTIGDINTILQSI